MLAELGVRVTHLETGTVVDYKIASIAITALAGEEGELTLTGVDDVEIDSPPGVYDCELIVRVLAGDLTWASGSNASLRVTESMP